MDPVDQASTDLNPTQLAVENVGVQISAVPAQAVSSPEQPLVSTSPVPIVDQVAASVPITPAAPQPQPALVNDVVSLADQIPQSSVVPANSTQSLQSEPIMAPSQPLQTQVVSPIIPSVGQMTNAVSPNQPNNLSQAQQVSPDIGQAQPQVTVSTPSIPIVEQLQNQMEVASQATVPAQTQQVSQEVKPTIMEQVNSGGFAAPTPAELELGTIGTSAVSSETTKNFVEPERVPGIVAGNDMQIVQTMTPTLSVAEEIKPVVTNQHPLHDLYEDLQVRAANSQLILEQELDAERQNKNYAKMVDEAAAWKITGRITNILMIISWALSLVSLFFPLIFKSSASHGQGLTADFILFVVSIMVLLTCTVLSFWTSSHSIIKIITWLLFVFFIIIFILISLHSAGIIKNGIPLIDGFLNRFSF